MATMTERTIKKIKQDLNHARKFLNFFEGLLDRYQDDLNSIEQKVRDKHNIIPVKEENTDMEAYYRASNGEQVVPVAISAEERQHIKGLNKTEKTKEKEVQEWRLWSGFDVAEFTRQYAPIVGVPKMKDILTLRV